MQAAIGINGQLMTMYELMTPYYRRKRFLRPRRAVCLRTVIRRYQLAELFGLTGAIVLVWIGLHLDNRSLSAPAPEPIGVESASVDLIIGVPAGKRRPL